MTPSVPSPVPAGTERAEYAPGDYAWIVVREGRDPEVMQRVAVGKWRACGGKTYYAGDIWDIVGPVAAVVSSSPATPPVDGYCVCDGGSPARDCGIPAHRASAEVELNRHRAASPATPEGGREQCAKCGHDPADHVYGKGACVPSKASCWCAKYDEPTESAPTADDVANLMERQLELLRERDALQRRIDAAYEALFPSVSLPVTPFGQEGSR